MTVSSHSSHPTRGCIPRGHAHSHSRRTVRGIEYSEGGRVVEDACVRNAAHTLEARDMHIVTQGQRWEGEY